MCITFLYGILSFENEVNLNELIISLCSRPYTEVSVWGLEHRLANYMQFLAAKVFRLLYSSGFRIFKQKQHAVSSTISALLLTISNFPPRKWQIRVMRRLQRHYRFMLHER